MHSSSICCLIPCNPHRSSIFFNDGRIYKIWSVALLVTHSLPAATSKDETCQMLGWGAGWAWLGAGKQHLLCVMELVCQGRSQEKDRWRQFQLLRANFRIGASVMRFSCVCMQVLVSHRFLTDFVKQLFSFSCDFLISGIPLFLDYLQFLFIIISEFSLKICLWLFLAFCIFSSIRLPTSLPQYPL